MRSPLSRMSMGLAALASGAALLACELVFPTVLSKDQVSDAGDASVDAPITDARPLDATTLPDSTGPACGMSPPPPPMTPAALGPQALLAAVQSVYVAEDAGPIAALGFDLDCVDTCPGPPSCVSPQTHCDQSDGRDLAANVFVQAVQDLQGSSGTQTLNGLISAGKAGALLYLSGYNGEADDSEVLISAIESTGIVSDVEAGTRAGPKWDGTDKWNVDPTSVLGVSVDDAGYHYTPRVVSTQAYVTNYTLVATVSGLPIPLGSTTITLSHAFVVATLTPVAGVGYRVDGQLAGRVSTLSILSVLATVKDPIDPTQFLCGNDGTFQSLLTSFCSSADIMFDPTLDRTDASCDSLSISIGFVAISAQFGAEYPKDPLILGCDGSVTDCPR